MIRRLTAALRSSLARWLHELEHPQVLTFHGRTSYVPIPPAPAVTVHPPERTITRPDVRWFERPCGDPLPHHPHNHRHDGILRHCTGEDYKL